MQTPPEHEQLLKLEAAVQADISAYAKCNLNEKSTIQTLNAAIQAKLSNHRALRRELEFLVEDLDSQEERQHIVSLLNHHATAYNDIQLALRDAAHQQRSNAVQTAAQARRELMQGADAQIRRRQLQNDSDVVAASEGITDSLRRTRQMLNDELQHTGSTLAAMEVSHQQLHKTHDEYVGQQGLLGKSKGLLRTLTWQNKSETWMLWFGLTLFMLVAAYVFQKRVAYFLPEAIRPATLAGKALSFVVPKQPPSGTGGPSPLLYNDKTNHHPQQAQHAPPLHGGIIKGKYPPVAPKRKHLLQPTPPREQEKEEESPLFSETASEDHQIENQQQQEQQQGEEDIIAVDLVEDFVKEEEPGFASSVGDSVDTQYQPADAVDSPAINEQEQPVAVVIDTNSNGNEAVPCTDEASECQGWVESGECERNPQFMIGDGSGFLGKCRLSCGAC